MSTRESAHCPRMLITETTGWWHAAIGYKHNEEHIGQKQSHISTAHKWQGWGSRTRAN